MVASPIQTPYPSRRHAHLAPAGGGGAERSQTTSTARSRGRSRNLPRRAASSSSAARGTRPHSANQATCRRVVAHRPGARQRASRDDEVRRPAHQLTTGRRDDAGVGGPRSHHPRVSAGQQADRGGGGRRAQVVEVVAESQQVVALDRHRLEPLGEPASQRVTAGRLAPSPLPTQSWIRVRGGRPVGVEVRRDDGRARPPRGREGRPSRARRRGGRKVIWPSRGVARPRSPCQVEGLDQGLVAGVDDAA